MSIEVVSGNLLDAKEKYICHQTNCTTMGPAAGVARAIFDRFDYSDVYADRMQADVPGTVDVRGNGKDQRFVIAMHAQVYPGSPSNPPNKFDTKQAREEYFLNCLLRLGTLIAPASIAFPFGIGCGLGGGNWESYYRMLQYFSSVNPVSKVVLYKLG